MPGTTGTAGEGQSAAAAAGIIDYYKAYQAVQQCHTGRCSQEERAARDVIKTTKDQWIALLKKYNQKKVTTEDLEKRLRVMRERRDKSKEYTALLRCELQAAGCAVPHTCLMEPDGAERSERSEK